MSADKAPVEEKISFPPHSHEQELMEFNSRPIISKDTSYNVQFAYGKRMYDLMGLRIFANGKQLLPSYDSIHGTMYSFSTRPTKIGEQSISVEVIFLNPHTHQMDTIQRDFYFEVDIPKYMVGLNKNNVLYKGIENHITVTPFGIVGGNTSLKVQGCRAKLRKNGKMRSSIHALDTGNLHLIYQTRGMKPKWEIDSFHYKVVELPNPVARIAGQQSGIIPSSEFSKNKQLSLALESVETDSTCKLQSYKLIYTSSQKDAQILKGKNLKFKGKILQAIQAAQPKDQYHFIDIMALCPADTKARRISSLVFVIK
ncbi:MAG: hypothetical protein GY810_31555 [Aureispira sp.]|nr:hypothetical protein [Aureispira sp.]